MKALRAAIYTQLAGDTALIAELGGATAVYHNQAPQGTARPYVIFFSAGGGPENIYPGSLYTERYVIKAVADTLNKALDVDAAINTAIHAATLTVTGTVNIWTRREQEISLTELAPDGRLIHHEGGYYRIRTDS